MSLNKINIKTVGIIANLNKKNALSTATKIVDYISIQKKTVILEQNLAQRLKTAKGYSKKEVIKKSDIVMSLGGDGTLLSTAREMEQKTPPIVGINLGGGLGFLTEISCKNLMASLAKILKQNYILEKRITLSAKITDKKGKTAKHSALNDIVINREALSRVLNLQIFIDDEYLTHYKSDGLIIATPTGSTAYSLSAGGSIVYPETQTILLTPICPHTVSNRPLIIPKGKKIKIKTIPPVKNAMLTIDGQIGIELKDKQEIEISVSKKVISLITLKENSFFKILREKLNWSGYPVTS